MEDNFEAIEIADKIRRGEQFGIFGRNAKVFFSDGKRYTYQTLWKGIRIANNLGEMTQCKTLAEECPDTYVGTYAYNFSKHRWAHAGNGGGIIRRIIQRIKSFS